MAGVWASRARRSRVRIHAPACLTARSHLIELLTAQAVQYFCSWQIVAHARARLILYLLSCDLAKEAASDR